MGERKGRRCKQTRRAGTRAKTHDGTENFRETGLDALLNRLTRDSRESCVARFGSFPCNLGVLFNVPGILKIPSFARKMI